MVAVRAAEKVSAATGRVLDRLKSVAIIGRPFSRSTAERWLALHNTLAQDENFIEIALVNGQGAELVKVSRKQIFKSSDLGDLSNQELFEQLKNKHNHIEPIQIDEVSEQPSLRIAVPITNIAGDLEGGLIAKVSLKFVWDLIASLKLGEEGLVYVVDRKGKLIAFHDLRRVMAGESVSGLAKIAAFTNSGEATTPSEASLETGISGNLSLTMYVPLTVPDWAVVVEVPFFEAYRPVLDYLVFAMVGIAMVSALAIVVGMLYARRLAAPLLDLTKTASLIADGELALETPVEGATEVRTLATAFNTMTTQLRSSIYSLEEKVTDNIRITSLLESARDEAEKSNRAKSEFLASMSHELRTPLNAVLGYAQMLQLDPKNPLSPAQNEHVDSIMAGGSHLLDLVNEILDLARIEADQLELSLEDVSAKDVIADCLGLIAPLGAQRDITFVDKYSHVQSDMLFTDRKRLKQVLVNLLSNAVKFNIDGGTVIVELQECDLDYLRIVVTDNGIGIPDEERADVFRLFHRLDTNSMIASEGTGIGLTVSKLLVDRMAGRIGFDSDVGEGSTFWLDLPLASNHDVLIWTNSLRIGIDAIDKDHQSLILLLNRIMRRSGDESDVSDVIVHFAECAKHHFKREDVIMKVCGSPAFEKHRDHHRQLLTNLANLIEAPKNQHNPDDFIRLRKSLRSWLVDHILEEDVNIASYAKDKSQEIQKALEDSGLLLEIVTLTAK
ncbi:MAG: HAMP domain-containing protein [Rhodospirillaceae bacterium]|nr:HAMP domain-containing protein [Rhodospirillaceae bacterium]